MCGAGIAASLPLGRKGRTGVSAVPPVRPFLAPLWTLPLPRFGIAVYLQTRASQAVKTEPIDIAFPGQKLIDRNRIEPTDLFDRDPAAAHRLDDGCLATHRPPLPQRG